MQVESIAVRLRMRSAMEAADLGVRLCQEAWRSVYPCYWMTSIPLTAFCLASFEIAAWLPITLLWWFKPWLDRSILFPLSRAAFGTPTTWRDLLREWGRVWGRQILKALTARRLSPWRSLTQPVHQLEGLSGSALRKRVRQVRAGKAGSAMLMTSAFSFVETTIAAALLSLPFWFAPPGQSPSLLSLFGAEETAVRFQLLIAIAYAITILFLEPFYVAAGFGMYLGRRVELEAWDIEQELRRAFA